MLQKKTTLNKLLHNSDPTFFCSGFIPDFSRGWGVEMQGTAGFVYPDAFVTLNFMPYMVKHIYLHISPEL